MEIAEIHVPKPVCRLSWGDPILKGGMSFMIYRDFNWLQRKMLKWCFGLDYHKL